MGIPTVFIVHHSHTDIGYTDLQENILDKQVEYIRYVLRMMKHPENDDFRWNCETFFCVERFLQEADTAQQEQFFQLAGKGKIGISTSYLNFCDLADSAILSERTRQMAALFQEHNITAKTAMNADINGISMGQRDALLNAGTEFLFMNIHTHHGMYPLYRNQNAFWWEAETGKRLLVWNGEHYNLGNFMGFHPNHVDRDEIVAFDTEHAAGICQNFAKYLEGCRQSGYPYDFIIAGISGCLSDNAPPNPAVLRMVEACNQISGQNLMIKMVSLQELYQELRNRISLDQLPVYKGDMTDWWASGIGSVPYAVKHYKSAQRKYHLAGRLAPSIYKAYPELTKAAQDNLLLYAEHTFGYSATITNPYETMVTDLDIRKTGYASKANEAATILLNKAEKCLGETADYYNSSGIVQATHTGAIEGKFPVEFFVAASHRSNIRVLTEGKEEMEHVHISGHPRGSMVSFLDTFIPGETKQYQYEILPEHNPDRFSDIKYANVGAERVFDIVNAYDMETCTLPYRMENAWFRIEYEIGKGITSFYNKKDSREMLSGSLDRFFTPIYEKTEIRTGDYEERRLLGRNIRGKHAVQHQAQLQNVRCIENGSVFTQMEFAFTLQGTQGCYVSIKMYKHLPKIEFSLKIAKELSRHIESIYLPLTLLGSENQEIYLKKGAEPFRPGLDQIPGTGMEFWMTDCGIAYVDDKSGVLIALKDAPLVYMGELRHHVIQLCDNRPENNRRPVFSWVMNNLWETNFKMDLSGFGEYRYSMTLAESGNVKDCFTQLEDSQFDVYTTLIQE